MASIKTKIRGYAERYADLVSLTRVLNDDCRPYAGPLLKVALSSRALPVDAAGISACTRALRGLADGTDAPTKARVLWFALTAIDSPPIDGLEEDERPFVERFYIRPLTALINGLDADARVRLRADMASDGCDMREPLVAQTLRSLFKAPADSRPRARHPRRDAA